jgi:hypothetical protein
MGNATNKENAVVSHNVSNHTGNIIDKEKVLKWLKSNNTDHKKYLDNLINEIKKNDVHIMKFTINNTFKRDNRNYAYIEVTVCNKDIIYEISAGLEIHIDFCNGNI